MEAGIRLGDVLKKNDLDRLCCLSSNEFKPATNRFMNEYGKPGVKLKIMCKARFCIDSKCCD